MSVKIHSVHVPQGKMPLDGKDPWKFTGAYSAYFDASIDGVRGKLFVNFYAGYKAELVWIPNR